jgi:predicted nucleotidyltransferase
MHRITNPNLEILEAVVQHLDELVDRLVFLGGCATGLLLTDVAAPPIRVTQDVDVITEVATLAEYYQLAELLRAGGFQADTTENAPICRWKAGGLLLDVMPTNPQLLGFGSVWYQEAFETAALQTLPSGKSVRMITGPYFLACKLAAFRSRGEGDYLMSHDMEDIVAVLDGRPEVVSEIEQAHITLRQHLVEGFKELLESYKFREALSGHLPPDRASQYRVSTILSRIEQIAKF